MITRGNQVLCLTVSVPVGCVCRYQTDTKKISAVSIFFETFPYRLNEVRCSPALPIAHSGAASKAGAWGIWMIRERGVDML